MIICTFADPMCRLRLMKGRCLLLVLLPLILLAACDDGARQRLQLEELERMNRADSLIREAEKILQEYGATLSAEDSSMIRSETDAFRKVREGGNAAVVRSVMESFTGELYAVLGRLYRQQNK